MGWSLIDHFRTFHNLSKEYDLSASARSVYFALLGEFNAAYWPEELRISDRQMQELSGVKSVATIHDARNLLKSLKVIDFRKGKNRKTIYRLLTERIPNTIQTPIAGLSEHQPNTCRALGEQSGLFAIPACAQEDLKTEKTEERKTSPPTPQGASGASAGTREKETLKGTEPPPDEDNDIFKVWAKETRIPLNARQRYELCELCEDPKYGFAKVKVAIERMADSRSYQTYDAFKEKLQEKPEPQPLKGGEKDNGEPEYHYELPPRTGNEPWANY